MSAEIHCQYALPVKPPRAASVASATASQPKFGSAATAIKSSANNFKLATSARALGMSEKIVETFLWGFIGLDVFGMWVPRIKVSLTRGAIPYDVRQDPEMKDKPLHKQVWKSFKENTKGLNWTNLYEEAGREFATGPGMLIVPTIVYVMANRAMGGQALRMSSKNLTEHGTKFSEHLSSLSASHALNRQQGNAVSAQSQKAFLETYRSEVKRYLLNVMKDDELAKFSTTEHLKQYRKHLPVAERETLEAMFPLKKVKTGQDYLDRWLTLWTERQVHPGKVPAQLSRQGKEEMAPAYAELDDLLINKFNENHMLAKHLEELHRGGQGKIDLMKANRISMFGDKRVFADFLGTKGVQGDLEKLGHYFSAIAGERLIGKPGRMADIAKGVMQHAGAMKTVQYLAAIVSGAYVAMLVKLTQKHDAYPGERLAHMAKDDRESHQEKHDLKTHQEASRLAYTPPIFSSASSPSPFHLPKKESMV